MAPDLADVNLAEGTIAVVGKGHTDATAMTLAHQTRAVLAGCVAVRRPEPRPLFMAGRPSLQPSRDV